MSKKQITIDGNEAASYVAYKVSEVIAIYPITPSSTMGENADEWAAKADKNIWGQIPLVQEMQSEAGAAGAVHGALQTGALTTTFTASQGLLLMIPNMYKIAGELTPAVFHVAARTLATHALSIFGDHSDVMAVRSTGFALLCSSNVQEIMDFAMIAHSATLKARIPFVHFFEGFRLSHEVAKIEQLSEEDIRSMIDEKLVEEHRKRALSPDAPVLRGTAQNPDVFFQAREAVNPYYNACAGIVEEAMEKFAKLTGRKYNLFDYYGPADAQRIIVVMGAGAETCQITADKLNASGEKVGLIKVRLYRPFISKKFVELLPKTTKKIAVLDRTKEPGAIGEPLYMDVVSALFENSKDLKCAMPVVVGGRFGLSSKEFTPSMAKAVYDELAKESPKNHFTVGITDDVTNTSLLCDPSFIIENDKGVNAIFYGLGADGTVSANKNSIKIIGEDTPNYAQGFFVYDSKKSGSITISHLRFGPQPIHATYLVSRASFVACHAFSFLEKYDVLEKMDDNGVFLLNTPYQIEETWDNLPKEVQEVIIKKKIKFYAIDAYKVAKEAGLGNRINTIMQTCFFAISKVLPKDEAIQAIKDAIKKAYGKKGDKVVQMNYDAVDKTLQNLHEIKVSAQVTSKISKPPVVSDKAPEYMKKCAAKMMCQRGDEIPVSCMSIDGTFPTSTSQWEKRNIAQEIPAWEKDICIQCGKCVAVCPHAVVRGKIYDVKELEGAPVTFKSVDSKDKEFAGKKYTIQIAPEDCTGCGVCVEVCPGRSKVDPTIKALNMHPQAPLRESEKANWEFFLKINSVDRTLLKINSVRGIKTLEPLFEFSGACAGCGETAYVKLISQLYGDRALIANATGCSSIYGANLPTTPWTKNKDGRGPAWSNSLFEDNAEFGFGYVLSVKYQRQYAENLLKSLESSIGSDLVKELLESKQVDEPEIFKQRERVVVLKGKLKNINSPLAKNLLAVADMLVKKSIWIIGGDGWAYDIGFGGLDHVIAQGENINILVLDTEVYSNTGGQASKATSRGAVAKFAAAGKSVGKKDLGRIAMTYGSVYVGAVSMGAKDEHTVKTFIEAEKYEGASLIIAYSSCIAHGIDMRSSLEAQKLAVASGYWPLYRYNPELKLQGKNPFVLDSAKPKIPFEEYAKTETRFSMLYKTHPERAAHLAQLAQKDIDDRWKIYEQMAVETTEVK